MAPEERAEAVRLIRDSAAAVAPPGGSLARIRALRFTDPGYDPAVLREMGALGWIGLRVPEARGGAGLGSAEACALAEALGAGLVPEPWSGASLSAAVLAAVGDDARLGPLLAGERLVLTAWQERADTLEVPASPDAPRRFLPMAAGADAFLLPVREGTRIALYAQPAAGADLTCERTQDGGHWGTLRPDLSRAERVADEVGTAIADALEDAALTTAAALLGGMARALAMTLDYLRTRQQFGRVIGGFQALQHRAADLHMQVALTRASVEAGAATLDAGRLGDARRVAVSPAGDAGRAAVSRAKARAADAALLVTRGCVQLSGGIGYTDDYDVGLFLRRAMVLANAYGSARLHRQRFMAMAPELQDA